MALKRVPNGNAAGQYSTTIRVVSGDANRNVIDAVDLPVANGIYPATVTLNAPNVTALQIPVSLDLRLPEVHFVAPVAFLDTVATDTVIVRGAGFDDPAAVLQLDGVTVNGGTPVSDTEVRFVPGARTAGTYEVKVPNRLDFNRATANLRVIDPLAYANFSMDAAVGLQETILSSPVNAMVASRGQLRDGRRLDLRRRDFREPRREPRDLRRAFQRPRRGVSILRCLDRQRGDLGDLGPLLARRLQPACREGAGEQSPGRRQSCRLGTASDLQLHRRASCRRKSRLRPRLCGGLAHLRRERSSAICRACAGRPRRHHRRARRDGSARQRRLRHQRRKVLRRRRAVGRPGRLDRARHRRRAELLFASSPTTSRYHRGWCSRAHSFV